MKTRKRTAKAQKLYAAVVVKGGQHFSTVREPEFVLSLSGRPDGDYAAFVDRDEKRAIERAIEARKKWEAKGYGPYRILAGVLTFEVRTPIVFELKGLHESL